MTRLEVTGKRNLAFSQWIRIALRDSKEGLTLTDIDWAFYDYKRGRLMIVEEKTGGAKISHSQKQIYTIIHQALSIAASIIRVESGKCLDYRGFHVLEMSGTRPDNSQAIKWDGQIITKARLIDLLNMDD